MRDGVQFGALAQDAQAELPGLLEQLMGITGFQQSDADAEGLLGDLGGSVDHTDVFLVLIPGANEKQSVGNFENSGFIHR